MSDAAQPAAVSPGVIERMVTGAWDDAREQAIEECAKLMQRWSDEAAEIINSDRCTLQANVCRNAAQAIRNLASQPSPADTVETEVQDTYLVGGPPDLKAMSGSVESDRVIQLHFRRKATDEDRKWLLDAINAKLLADKAPAQCSAGNAREALAPFAKLADQYDEAHTNRVRAAVEDGALSPRRLPDGHRVSIGMGDIRRAQQAFYAPAEPQEVQEPQHDHRVYFACECCSEHEPEHGVSCRSDIGVMPDGTWLCDNCYSDCDKTAYGIVPCDVDDFEFPRFEDLPRPAPYSVSRPQSGSDK